MIENYFNRFPGQIFSFNYVKGIKTIHFWMKNTWVVPEGMVPSTMDIQYNKESVDEADPSRFYAVIYTVPPAEGTDHAETSYEEVYETLANIFDHNIEEENKQALLQQKIREMQEQFASLTLDQLQKMAFK